MKQYKFRLQGGVTLTLKESSLSIDIAGMKGIIFQRVKPRTKDIPYEAIKRIDYKGAGFNIGYIRFITSEIEEYPSSLYVAENCPNSFIFEKEEMERFNEVMNELQKKLPNVEKVHKKM